MCKCINLLISCIEIFKKTYIIILLLLAFPQYSLAEEQRSIRFGVLSIAQPSRIFNKWQPFADYMSKHLGQPVEIVVPRGFGKMKQNIANGDVDFFYINSHVFYRLKQEGKAIAIGQMQNISGKTTSRSEIFVKRDSGINFIDDLKGKRIAYISPMGAGGYLSPRAHLYKSGLKSGVDTEEVFTKNLSNSIHGVLLGDYDAATMCGVNYKLMSAKIETGELKILAVSNEYPENVIGARTGLAPELVEKFRNILLSIAKNPEGQALLDKMHSMKIKSFVSYDESMEEITKDLIKAGHL